MSIIAKLATAIEREPSTELESMCRRSVAIAMQREKRMLTADEIEDIVDDVVHEEAIPALEELFDGNEVEVSDIEIENIPEEEIVVFTDEDGEKIEGVVVEGRFARLKVVPDFSVRTISASISKHSEALAIMANVNEGINLKSLYHPVPDVNMPCPKCSSRNVTPVWFDSGQVIACCNECCTEFDASIDDVAHATLAERTVEDIDILPEADVFGSVWLEDEGYGYEVYAEGEMIDAGEAETFDEVQERFDEIADAYDEIEEGVEVEFVNGESEVIEGIEDDEVLFEAGKKASRVRLARMVADKKAFLDKSALEEDELEPGDSFKGEEEAVVVEEIDGDAVYARIINCAADGRLAEKVSRFTRKEFKSYLVNNKLS